MVLVDLPAQPTSFVGRTEELAEIITLLNNSDCRLITLVGPGGMGKTRLALQAGLVLGQREKASDSTRPAELFDPCNIYFVPLQPINSPEFILSAVAEAVGLQFYAGSDPQKQLIDYLRPKSLLLILDNFEHLLDAVYFIAELLASAPNIKLLVTSRETLNLREEWLYPVKGMNFPIQDDGIDPESYSAVQLFVQHARRVRPDFSLATEQKSVLRICRLVEGMPLALEMTAAWLRRLPADQIAKQLERGLDILEIPARNAPARHRSMRAVFDHSWNLLSEAEQDGFKKLSVFRGGFSREAVQAITGATLGVLSALIDKSLLNMDADGRYDLHELVRQYADEKLAATPDISQQARESHSRYYMDFLAERDHDMTVHMHRSVIAEITAELKNVRFALDWVLEQGEIEHYSEAMSCLTLFYQFRCFFAEGEEVSARIVANLRRKPPGEMLGRMLIMQGWFVELRSQDYARAIPLLEEGSRLSLETDSSDCTEGLLHLSDVAVQMGDYERALELAQQCVNYYAKKEEFWTRTFDLAHLGYVHLLLGNYTEAEQLIREAIRIAEKYDVPSGISDARNNLGEVQLALHAYQDARQTFSENLEYSKQSAYLKGTVLALVGAAETERELGDYPEAREHLYEALITATESNQVPYILSSLSVAAALLMQTDRWERAAQIVALVLGHHAASHETKRYGNRLLTRLELQLSPEALAVAAERARSNHVEEVVQALLENELSENPAPSGADSAGPLTERELEILRLTADGLSNREIAEQLFLAVGTVKWYLSEIYAKLNVTSRTQATARARDLNLLT